LLGVNQGIGFSMEQLEPSKENVIQIYHRWMEGEYQRY